jgi:hypothetical protein
MRGYKEDKTQEQRILDALRLKGKEGLFVWEFMMPRNRGGLGVAAYTARIWGLRQKGYLIENVEPGHYILKEELKPLQNNLI